MAKFVVLAGFTDQGARGLFSTPRSFVRPCTHKSRLVSSGWSMSALLPKTDIRQRFEHVCFVP